MLSLMALTRPLSPRIVDGRKDWLEPESVIVFHEVRNGDPLRHGRQPESDKDLATCLNVLHGITA